MEQKRNSIYPCPIKELKVFDFKYKDEDLEKLMMLEGSMSKYGQLKPIIVMRQGLELIAIEGRKILVVAAKLGWLEVDILEVTQEPILLGIILNELQFETNYIELSKHVQVITKNRNLLPFSPIELDKLQSISEFDWSQLTKADNPEQITLF